MTARAGTGCACTGIPAFANPTIQKTDLGLKQVQTLNNSFNFNMPLPTRGTGFGNGIGLPPFIPPFLGGFPSGGTGTRKKKKKGKVAPSLTAEVFDITG